MFKRTKSDIEHAVFNAKASMELEGFKCNKEDINMIEKFLINKITKKEMIEKALKNVGISKI